MRGSVPKSSPEVAQEDGGHDEAEPGADEVPVAPDEAGGCAVEDAPDEGLETHRNVTSRPAFQTPPMLCSSEAGPMVMVTSSEAVPTV